MKKRLVNLSILIFFLTIVSTNASAGRFGHIFISLDSTAADAGESMQIQLEGEKKYKTFDGNDQLYIWNVNPGRYNLQLLFTDNQPTRSVYIEVLPNLTTGIEISKENRKFVLNNEGVVDISGHVFVLDREDIEAFPGELQDGIGLLAGRDRDSVLYNYENLNMNMVSFERQLDASGKSFPDFAVVNISDPFAGYDASDISLVSNYYGPDVIGLSGTYATRDRRFYRITGGQELPRQLGSIYGSLTFENLGDADPSILAESRLRHNSADNFEVMAGGNADIFMGIKAEVSAFYKSNTREFYRHRYLHNYKHAPEEKLKSYAAEGILYGWLNDITFLRVGFGIFGDDYKLGDGVHFDDILKYARVRNPGYDSSLYFYQSDNENTKSFYDYIIDTSIINNDTTFDTLTNYKITRGDEGHVFEEYRHYNTDGFKLSLGIDQSIGSIGLFSLSGIYQKSKYRYYRPYYPTSFNPFNINYTVQIGFDKLGNNQIDKSKTFDIPEPEEFALSLGYRKVSSKYFINALIGLVAFNSNMPHIGDFYNIFENYENTKTKTELDIRIGMGFHLNQNLTIFGNYSLTHEKPANNFLYFDSAFMDDMLFTGIDYPFENPDLDFIENAEYEIGGILKMEDYSLTLSVMRIFESNIPYVKRYSGYGAPYILYENDSREKKSTRMAASLQRKGRYALTYVLGGFYETKDSYWRSQDDIDYDTYRITGMISFRPANITGLKENPFGNILKRCIFLASINFSSGPIVFPNYPPWLGESSKDIVHYADIFELNFGVNMRVFEFKRARMSIELEILNLLDNENLDAPEYEDPMELFDDPADPELPYPDLLTPNPNRYGRPRMIRFGVRLEY